MGVCFVGDVVEDVLRALVLDHELLQDKLYSCLIVKGWDVVVLPLRDAFDADFLDLVGEEILLVEEEDHVCALEP